MEETLDLREETPVPEAEEPAAPEEEAVTEVPETPEREEAPELSPEEEVRDFRRKYPGVDLTRLLESGSAFARFSRGRLGQVPLTELYQDYQFLVEQTRQETLRTAAARQNRSTGAASVRAAGDYGLTDAQKELLEDWNRRNPGERMSAKEYAALLKR